MESEFLFFRNLFQNKKKIFTSSQVRENLKSYWNNQNISFRTFQSKIVSVSHTFESCIASRLPIIPSKLSGKQGWKMLRAIGGSGKLEFGSSCQVSGRESGSPENHNFIEPYTFLWNILGSVNQYVQTKDFGAHFDHQTICRLVIRRHIYMRHLAWKAACTHHRALFWFKSP